ncbi:ATP-binding protein, partial [Streptomyces sp. SP17KL33]|nr:ATP-binding protein [Streptomyces sp. SP18BB07]MEE1832057.1 ATP-binding protein [Streptomyces sp. SP17KL33]
ADTGRVGQHGLEIVMAVAQGFEARQEPVGKRITARIALTHGTA